MALNPFEQNDISAMKPKAEAEALCFVCLYTEAKKIRTPQILKWEK